MDPFELRPPADRRPWEQAFDHGDDALLEHLAAAEPPGVVALAVASFVNGRYHYAGHPDVDLAATIEQVRRADRCMNLVRRRVGWRQRDLDRGVMRFIRRSGALSAVIGAGATMAAGGPSWPQLVRRLLEVARPRFGPAELRAAAPIVAAIDAGDAGVEALAAGAQLCLDSLGQHAFTHITGFLYGERKERPPGPVHEALAAVAAAPGPPSPGWEAMISYNFDALAGEALEAAGVPNASWAMRGDDLKGDPRPLAQEAGQDAPRLDVYHLHGYTPRRRFRITEVRFVLSTSQFREVYEDRPAVIDRVYDDYLANPIHHALYVGCSFTDEAMNELLRRAARQYPGRPHWALLQWPGEREYRRATAAELDAAAARYVAMGVRPVWFDRFDEIPGMIRSLA